MFAVAVEFATAPIRGEDFTTWSTPVSEEIISVTLRPEGMFVAAMVILNWRCAVDDNIGRRKTCGGPLRNFDSRDATIVTDGTAVGSGTANRGPRFGTGLIVPAKMFVVVSIRNHPSPPSDWLLGPGPSRENTGACR